MPVTRRRSKENVEEEMRNDGILIPEEESPPTEVEVQRTKLRQCWELASVLNFLNVFEPVIESNLKFSAEEIETALIEPNDSLTQLHIALLKGIVPPKKSLDASEAWMSILSRKLAMWWPWVAEGDFPLTTTKGEEMNKYMQLDPTVRLSVLKALCEIRADQNDVVSYINDGVKNGETVSTFRKEKLGDNGNDTAYWYDGSAIIGHRLYKEVYTFEHKPKAKDKYTNEVAINCQWETLATNFEEFQRMVNKFSSSELQWEVSVGKTVEADAMPALQKLQRKKDRLLKLQKKQDMLLNGFRTSRITRFGRNCQPISYRYEDYDRAIQEAIEVTQKRKTAEKPELEKQVNKRKKGQNLSTGDSDNTRDSELTESDADSKKHQEDGNDQSRKDATEGITANNDKNFKNLDQEHGETPEGNDLVLHFQKLNGRMVDGPKGSRCSERVAGPASETMSITSKQRLRQRPTINTAAESAVVPDSEDENESE